MTRSVYIIGGAGSGKSTFMAELLSGLGCEMGPQEDLYRAQNARGNPVVLRGHRLGNGLYIGKMRDEFPGTDGLDRASSMPGTLWLSDEASVMPEFIVAEGSTLSTAPFLTALHQRTELLLVQLWCDEFVRELRYMARGSNQNEGWIKNSYTRAGNLLTAMRGLGVTAVAVDSADPVGWKVALAACLNHLKGSE